MLKAPVSDGTRSEHFYWNVRILYRRFLRVKALFMRIYRFVSFHKKRICNCTNISKSAHKDENYQLLNYYVYFEFSFIKRRFIGVWRFVFDDGMWTFIIIYTLYCQCSFSKAYSLSCKGDDTIQFTALSTLIISYCFFNSLFSNKNS